MTFEQIAILVILAAMLAAYATERFRVEIVALSGLTAGYLAGLVPAQSVFAGFANPAVITVIEILLVVAALSRTRVIESLAGTLTSRAQGETGVVLLLCSIGAAVSVFMNNIGALALLFPVSMSICKRLAIPPAKVLMPLSFATLLGGMCSLTGTPANLVVNEWVARETGRNLGYFELGIVGAPLTLAGIAFVVLAGPRLFGRSEGAPELPLAQGNGTITERTVATGSPLVGEHLPEIESRYGVQVHAVLRNEAHVFARRSDILIAVGDVVLIEGGPTAIAALERDKAFLPAIAPVSGEFVVMPESLLLGSRVEDLEALSDGTVRVASLSSRRGRIEGRLGDLPLSMGDVIALSGEREAIAHLAADCNLLALSTRRTDTPVRRAGVPLGLFCAGVLGSAFDFVPTEIAFGAVVLALIFTRSLDLRDALQDLNWGIVILLAAMIPLGAAVEQTGSAAVIANAIANILPTGEPLIVVLAMIGLAVGITPFIDNVSAAVILSPIAAGLASRTGTPVEPMLIAVAVGVSLDFLTPFGHHNNAVVMGVGGYRFRDFARLGAPLTVLLVGVAAVAFWLLLSV